MVGHRIARAAGISCGIEKAFGQLLLSMDLNLNGRVEVRMWYQALHFLFFCLNLNFCIPFAYQNLAGMFFLTLWSDKSSTEVLVCIMQGDGCANQPGKA